MKRRQQQQQQQQQQQHHLQQHSDHESVCFGSQSSSFLSYSSSSLFDHSQWNCYAIVAIFAIICYANSLNGDFVHDDIPAIMLNRDVLGKNPLISLFKNDFWGTSMSDTMSHKSYRPLTTLTFRINNLLFGLKSIWFHGINILLHATSSVLFTRICTNVAGFKIKFALISGILFAVHPIHTEAVSGIVGRAEILACTFFSISLLFYHGHIDKNPDEKSVTISIFFGGLSMLAKETGITVFLVNMLYDVYRNWSALKKTIIDVRWNEETYQFIKRTLRVLLSMIILLVARLALLQGSLPKFSTQDNPAAFHPNFSVRLLTFSYLSAFNFWLLLCPSTLAHDWQAGSISLVTSIRDSRNLLTVITFCAIIFLFYKIFIDMELQRHVPVVIGVLLLVIPFLPATNLLVTVGFVVAERVLYIPSMGCVMLVLYGVQILYDNVPKIRRILQLSCILLICFFCLKTVIRNKDWHSRESLIRSGLKVLPNNAKMHYNYANYLREKRSNNLAKYHYQIALQLWPNYASAYNNLGTLIGDLDVAEKHFLAAVDISSEHINAHYNLGQIYRKTNRTFQSIKMFEKCIKYDPTFVPAYVGLAKLKNGLISGVLLQRAIALNEENVGVRLEYGDWLLKNNLLIAALREYSRGFQYKSADSLSLTVCICKTLRQMGQTARLHQIILRFHLILRQERVGFVTQSNIYLRDWHIKHEIKRRALVYDTIHRINDYSSNKDSEILIPSNIHTDIKMLKIPYCNRSGSVYISSKGNFCDTLISQVPSSDSNGDSTLLKSNYKLVKRNKKWSKNRYKYKEEFDNAGIKQAMIVNAIDKL